MAVPIPPPLTADTGLTPGLGVPPLLLLTVVVVVTKPHSFREYFIGNLWHLQLRQEDLTDLVTIEGPALSPPLS